jgi:hypothetical protein
MMSGFTVEEWVGAYRTAWVEADADLVASLFTPDGTYRDNIFEEAHVGTESIKTYWQTVTAVQSEVDVLMGLPFVDGSRVTVEFWTNMLVAGDPVTLPGCLLLDFDPSGLCTSLREYWHFQPGTFAPPAGWGT